MEDTPGGKEWDTVKPLDLNGLDVTHTLLVDNELDKAYAGEEGSLVIVPTWEGLAGERSRSSRAGSCGGVGSRAERLLDACTLAHPDSCTPPMWETLGRSVTGWWARGQPSQQSSFCATCCGVRQPATVYSAQHPATPSGEAMVGSLGRPGR